MYALEFEFISNTYRYVLETYVATWPMDRTKDLCMHRWPRGAGTYEARESYKHQQIWNPR